MLVQVMVLVGQHELVILAGLILLQIMTEGNLLPVKVLANLEVASPEVVSPEAVPKAAALAVQEVVVLGERRQVNLEAKASAELVAVEHEVEALVLPEVVALAVLVVADQETVLETPL